MGTIVIVVGSASYYYGLFLQAVQSDPFRFSGIQRQYLTELFLQARTKSEQTVNIVESVSEATLIQRLLHTVDHLQPALSTTIHVHYYDMKRLNSIVCAAAKMMSVPVQVQSMSPTALRVAVGCEDVENVTFLQLWAVFTLFNERPVHFRSEATAALET